MNAHFPFLFPDSDRGNPNYVFTVAWGQFSLSYGFFRLFGCFLYIVTYFRFHFPAIILIQYFIIVLMDLENIRLIFFRCCLSFFLIKLPVDLSVKTYPVIVFLEGEMFTQGNPGKYPAEDLAAEGLVVVSVHYRLGIFGKLTCVRKIDCVEICIGVAESHLVSFIYPRISFTGDLGNTRQPGPLGPTYGPQMGSE